MFFLKQDWYPQDLWLLQEHIPSFHNLIARGLSTLDGYDIMANNQNVRFIWMGFSLLELHCCAQLRVQSRYNLWTVPKYIVAYMCVSVAILVRKFWWGHTTFIQEHFTMQSKHTIVILHHTRTTAREWEREDTGYAPYPTVGHNPARNYVKGRGRRISPPKGRQGFF